jgi:hypothetical protein
MDVPQCTLLQSMTVKASSMVASWSSIERAKHTLASWGQEAYYHSI